MNIYVATDQKGMICQAIYTDDLFHLAALTESVKHEARYGKLTVRPIAVTTTDGIIGKHWQDVDETMLMLRECRVVRGEESLRWFAENDHKAWCHFDADGNGNNVYADLHTALTHLTKKEA